MTLWKTDTGRTPLELAEALELVVTNHGADWPIGAVLLETARFLRDLAQTEEWAKDLEAMESTADAIAAPLPSTSEPIEEAIRVSPEASGTQG